MERDLFVGRVKVYLAISIHALRMERDDGVLPPDPAGADFNPRAPHGARPSLSASLPIRAQFQSTRSAWSAT